MQIYIYTQQQKQQQQQQKKKKQKGKFHRTSKAQRRGRGLPQQ